MALVDKIIRGLEQDGHYGMEGTESSSEFIFNVDIEDNHIDDFLKDLDNALLYLGYSPLDFDGVEIDRLGKSRWDPGEAYISNYEVILYKDLY